VLRAKENETILTRVFDIVQEAKWPEVFPGRALVNDFATRWTGDEDGLKAALPEAQAEFTAARQRDDYATAYIYAGQSVGLVRKVLPAAELVRSLMGDAEAVLRANMDGLIS
jgi:nitronate monooxygenase